MIDWIIYSSSRAVNHRKSIILPSGRDDQSMYIHILITNLMTSDAIKINIMINR